MFLSDKEPVRTRGQKGLHQEEVEPVEPGEEQDDVKEVHKKRRTLSELEPAVIDDVSVSGLCCLMNCSRYLWCLFFM